MAGSRLRSLALLAVVVVALGAVAATVDSGSLGGGADAPPDAGPDFEFPEPPDEQGGGGLCPDPLRETPGFVGFAAVVVLAGGTLGYRRPAATPLVAAVGAPLLLVGANCASLLGGLSDLGRLGALAPSPMALLAGMVLALVGALAFLYVRSDDPVGLDDGVDVADAPVDLEAVGRAAGAAADRIEGQADVTNEVYRAWTEMVRHLRVTNPEATTPDEFERRAIEAGMDAEEVSELTRLFEEVRYGERAPEARETRAVDALRRIERAYAADANGPDEAATGASEDDPDGGDGDR